MDTGVEHLYVMKENKRLRCGYTTGSCAAAAAHAAVLKLLRGKVPKVVDLMTPKGILLHLPVMEVDEAVCGVIKDAGDDPDVTDGALICASAELIEMSIHTVVSKKVKCCAAAEETYENIIPESHPHAWVRHADATIFLDGGEGVGRVTKPGLTQQIGEAAINKVPRRMIFDAAEKACEECGYTRGILITILVPEGKRLAEKTFNSRLGIEGGISILGTTGIVEPMSEESLIASIRLEMSMRLNSSREDGGTDAGETETPDAGGTDAGETETSEAGGTDAEETETPEAGGTDAGETETPDAGGTDAGETETSDAGETKRKAPRYLLVVPGRYGENFVRDTLHLDAEQAILCSNYVGKTVDLAVELGADGILFAAHIGKFIKVAGGIMNTHSREADARAELCAAYALRAGISGEDALRILDTRTTDEAVDIMKEAGVLPEAMKLICASVKGYLQHRCDGKIRTEAILYNTTEGLLGMTDGAEEMLKTFR